MQIKRDNFGFTHKSGILMPLSSLPSKYGIGTFGAPSYEFIDFLAASGQRCWQVLPLNPTAYGDSPYQSPSSFSGNPYFIDLETLKQDGLLTLKELKSAEKEGGRVDYGWLFNTRIALLKKAFARFESNKEYEDFKAVNKDWLDDYAYFMALKENHNYCAWASWEDKFKFYDKAKAYKDDFSDEIEFWCFVQYLFGTQWDKVREYAHSKNISIVGDMPIYVAYDSVEVWCDPSQYLLDENLNPTLVAGCPPDGFAPDGQLWGNPIYNWEAMKKDGFKWWIKRLRRSCRLYDIVRIDHFRGFAGYYVIKYGEPTAKDGWWEQGCGKELFSVLNKEVPQAKIIAEDLGFITDDVRELLEFTGYPGMKNLQFAFFDDDAEYLPRRYKDGNCVVYTGTHDSDATKEWCDNLDYPTLRRFYKECPMKGDWTMTYALIMLALKSKANLAIIPLQDYLELGDESRMNRPATAEGNWTWRVYDGYNTDALAKKILTANIAARRVE